MRFFPVCPRLILSVCIGDFRPGLLGFLSSLSLQFFLLFFAKDWEKFVIGYLAGVFWRSWQNCDTYYRGIFHLGSLAVGSRASARPLGLGELGLDQLFPAFATFSHFCQLLEGFSFWSIHKKVPSLPIS